MCLKVRLLTPEGVVLYDKVEEVILPTITGKIGILKGHAPLLTGLKIGVLQLKIDKGWTKIVLLEGFCELENDLVTVVSNSSEEGNSIVLEAATEYFEKAILLRDQANTKKEKIVATATFQKAKARVEASS
jgi:ATP synthase F1 epsilon subunit